MLGAFNIHVVEPGYRVTNAATGEVEIVDDSHVITVGADLFCTPATLDAVKASPLTRTVQ